MTVKEAKDAQENTTLELVALSSLHRTQVLIN